MSELKAIHAFDVYEEYTKTGDDEAAQVYLKSEADNIISTIRAERDEYRYNLSCARNEIHNLSMSMREDVKRIADKDKVIADLEESHKMEVEQLLIEIAELKARIADGDRDFDWAEHQNEMLLQIVRHHKYKRCLENAEICCEKKENCYNRALRKYSKDEADYLVRKSDFWEDWEFRWLKIAEQFKDKEAK